MPRPDVRLQLVPRRLPAERALELRAAGQRLGLRVHGLHVPAELLVARGGGAAERAARLPVRVGAIHVTPRRRFRGQHPSTDTAHRHGGPTVRSEAPSPSRGGGGYARPSPPRGACWERRGPPVGSAARGGVVAAILRSGWGPSAAQSAAGFSGFGGSGRGASPLRWVRAGGSGRPRSDSGGARCPVLRSRAPARPEALGCGGAMPRAVLGLSRSAGTGAAFFPPPARALLRRLFKGRRREASQAEPGAGCPPSGQLVSETGSDAAPSTLWAGRRLRAVSPALRALRGSEGSPAAGYGGAAATGAQQVGGVRDVVAAGLGDNAGIAGRSWMQS